MTHTSPRFADVSFITQMCDGNIDNLNTLVDACATAAGGTSADNFACASQAVVDAGGFTCDEGRKLNQTRGKINPLLVSPPLGWRGWSGRGVHFIGIVLALAANTPHI